MSTLKIIEGYSRDLELPKDWQSTAEAGTMELYNAARPFPAHHQHTGVFVRGVFWGMINPAEEYADERREKALKLDAHRVEFVKRATIEEYFRAKCKEYNADFDSFEYDDMAESWMAGQRRYD